MPHCAYPRAHVCTTCSESGRLPAVPTSRPHCLSLLMVTAHSMLRMPPLRYGSNWGRIWTWFCGTRRPRRARRRRTVALSMPGFIPVPACPDNARCLFVKDMCPTPPPGRRLGTPWAPPAHTASALPGRQLRTAWASPKHRTNTAWAPPGHRQSTAARPPMITARARPEHRPGTTRAPPGHRPSTSRAAPGDLLPRQCLRTDRA